MKCTILVVLTLAVAACNRSERTGSEATDMNTEVHPAQRSAADDPPPAADNTKKNQRDLSEAAQTPGDQGESEADRTITQQIRQGIVGNDALSMTAENVKIITDGGVVTLRGPVKSVEERSTIETIAQRTSGVKRVDNQLEIASR